MKIIQELAALSLIFKFYLCQIVVPTSTWRFAAIPPQAPIDKKFEIQLTDVRATGDARKTVTWRMDRNAAHVCSFKQGDDSLVATTTEENPIFTCNHEGFHGIEYIINEGENDEFRVRRNLRMKSTPFCFQWFAQVLYSYVYKDPEDNNRIKSQILVGVWVVDYLGGGQRHMSAEELDGSATQPSDESKQRSYEFHVLGNYPNMTFTQTDDTKPVAAAGFNTTERLWYFVVQTEFYSFFEATLRVTDQSHISRMNCFIQPLEFILDHGDIFKQYSPKTYDAQYFTKLQDLGYAKYPAFTIVPSRYNAVSKVPVGLANYPPADQITLQWQNPDAIVKDACSPSLALFLRNADSTAYFTRDGFQTNQALFTVPNIDGTGADNHQLLSAAFTAEHLMILAQDGTNKKWLHAVNKITSDYTFVDIPQNVQLMRGRDWCIGNYVGYLLTDNEYVLVWDPSAGQEEIYVASSNRNVLTVPIPLADQLNLAPPDARQIIDAAFTNYPSSFGVLMSLSIAAEGITNALYVLVHNFERSEWESFPVTNEANVQATFNAGDGPHVLQFQQSGDIGFVVLLKTAKQIYTYYKSSVGSRLIAFPDTVTPTDNQFKDFVISSKGEMILLMTPDYQVFYHKILLQDFPEIPKILDTAVNYLPWFDGRGELYFINEADRSRIYYDVNTEVVSRAWPLDFCQFRKFIHNISKPIYYFDKKETMQFRVAIAFRPIYAINAGSDQGIDINLQVNTVGLELSSTSSTKEHHLENQWITAIENITITHNKDFLEIPDYAVENAKQSLVGLEIRPKLARATCPSPVIVTSYLVVGCLGNRKTIRVSVPKKCSRPSSYTIPAERYSPYSGTKQRSLKVEYDPNWGCPIRHKASDVFKPTVQLLERKADMAENPLFDPLDFNILDDNVPVNFVMYEKYGRTGLKYSASMLDNNCVRLAQTFTEMRAASPEVHVDTVWTPENYKSCFTEDGSNPSLDTLSKKYEVLNNSQNNGILFPSDINGLYVLKLRIIDPNYSFCDLTTEFAVEVYGAVEPVDYNYLAYILVVFLVIIGAFLVSSYIYFTVSVYPKIREEYEM